MALSFRTRRTVANALRRAWREPRQLLGLLIVVVYAGASLGMIVALLVVPLPGPLLDALQALIPGGLQAQIAGVRGGLIVALLLLGCAAAFQNPLLQFGQAEIDLVFATPIPAWRLLLDRLLLNHLRALAAAYFFWGLSVAPLVRLAGLPLWPEGAWGMAGLTLLFATVDQGCAAALLRMAGRGGSRWLARAGLLAGAALALLLLAASADRLLSGEWRLLGAIAGAAGGGALGVVLLPIGLAADLLLATAAPPGGLGLPLRLGALAGLDLLTALLLVGAGRANLRELALSPLGRGGLLLTALARSRLNPLRFAQLVWSPERDDGQPAEGGSALRPFGRGAGAIVWARTVELQRSAPRNLLALGALGLLPLLILLRRADYSLGSTITAVVFSASLGTQLFNDLADYLTRADTDLALPMARWRLVGAALLARLPVYWAGGLILLGGAGLLQEGARWGELAALALWYPLLLVPLVALRGALMFVYPAAALPGRRDPVQAVVVLLLNGLLTMGLLLLSLLPLGVLLALSQIFSLGIGWLWPVMYLCGGALSALALLALFRAYGRYEPGEGV